MGDAIYSQAGSPDGATGAAGAEGASAGAKAGSASDEDIVDAEIIDEDEAKK